MKRFSEVLSEGMVKDESLVVFLAIGMNRDSETLSMVERKNLDLFRLNMSPAALNRVKTSWTPSLCSSVDLEYNSKLSI